MIAIDLRQRADLGDQKIWSHFRHGPSNVGIMLSVAVLSLRSAKTTERGTESRPGEKLLLARRPVDGRGRRLIDPVVVYVGDHSDHIQPGSVRAHVEAFPYGTLDGIPCLVGEALGHQGHVPLVVQLRPIEVTPGE